MTIATISRQPVVRPEGFTREKRDCLVRSLSLAGNIPYDKVHAAFKSLGRKDGHGLVGKDVIQKVVKILGLKASQVARHGSVNRVVEKCPKGNLFCVKRGHAFAIIDGVAHDLDTLKSHIKGAWLITKAEVN